MTQNNTTTPLVSVLLPVYNTKEEYLRACIDSILKQSFTDFELLIVNDCSTNSQVECIIKSYDDKRIQYYVNEKNLGISGTRNRLMSLAKGKYWAIVDHDDISLPDRFQKQVFYLEHHPEVGVVSGGILQYDEPKNRKYPILHAENDNDIKLRLARECELYHPAAMLRADTLKAHHIVYEEEYSPAEDRVLWYRLLPFTKFYNIQEPLIIYRWHSSNTSKTQQFKMDCAIQKARILFEREFPEISSVYPEVTKVKVLSIPVLKIKREINKYKIYLFGIQILSIKKM